MFEYLHYKRLKQKLIHRLDQGQTKMNQPIWIRDLFAYCKAGESYGELVRKFVYKSFPPLDRLIKHIEILARITDQHHRIYNYFVDSGGNYQIRPECINHITRLLLPEFSLYPGQPLNIDQYNTLLSAVDRIARQQAPNVHLLLSSLPVVYGQTVFNTVLYVQCGEAPEIRTFCKTSTTCLDMNYRKLFNFTRQKVRWPRNRVSQFILPLHGQHTVSNQSVFTVSSQGGAKYIQAIDICYDSCLNHSKKLINDYLNQPTMYFGDFIPDQVDHIVTSNSIDVSPLSKITDTVVQIDPRRVQTANPMDDNVVHCDDLRLDAESVSVTKEQATFLIQNPPFGGDYQVLVQHPRQLDSFSGELKPKVDKANQSWMTYRLKTHLSDTVYKPYINDINLTNNTADTKPSQ